jgi:signal transduction histidine kinase
VAGVFVAAIGAIVLAGWAFHIDALRSMHGSITMKTNMAVGLLLCGLALCFHVRRAKTVGIICATVAAALGVLTLSEHLVGWDLGIDLLDISRASVGQFELSRRPISFNTLVQGSLEALAPGAVAKTVHLRSELDPALGLPDADPDRLQQIVSNLVSNAIKFTDAGGRVTIRTALDGDEATLTVIDTGIGFDETFAAQLFQPFRQADSSTRREHGGLGLGLSIARHIAELHGGSITGYSAGPQRGATFGLRLPIRLTGDRPGAQEAASTLQIA